MFPLKKLARKGYHLSFTYSSGVVVPLIKYECDPMHLIGSYYKRLKKHPKWSEVLVTLSHELSFLSITVTRVSCQRVLLRRGHVGQFYYIVYSGSVFVNVQDTRADGQVFHKTQAILTKGDAFGVRLTLHDDVIKWKPFPRYWPFVRGIHLSPVNSRHKGQWRGALMFSLICALNKRFSKQSWGWWFETPSCSLWRHCNGNENFVIWWIFLHWLHQKLSF